MSSVIKIVPYNKKSFILTGYTTPYRENIKRLGGKWNRNLSKGPIKRAWIFSNSKLWLVQEWINTLNPIQFSPIKRKPIKKPITRSSSTESNLSLISMTSDCSNLTIVPDLPYEEVFVPKKSIELWLLMLIICIAMFMTFIIKDVQVQIRSLDEIAQIGQSVIDNLHVFRLQSEPYNPFIFLSNKLNYTISLKDL